MRSLAVIILLLSVTRPAFSKIMHFKIKQIEGVALVWLPHSSQWRSATKDTTLPAGTLLQLQNSDRVVIELIDEEKKGGRSFVLEAPAITRLDVDLLRPIEVDIVDVRDPRAVGDDSDSEDPSEPFLYEIWEAWNRVVAFVKDGEDTDDSEVPGEIVSPEILGDRFSAKKLPLQKKIEITQPTSTEPLAYSTFPAALDVTWSAPASDPTKEFEVSVTKVGDENFKLEVVTKQKRHQFLIRNPGEYMVRVSEKDGPMTADLRRIKVESIPTEVTAYGVPVDPEISLLSPPENFYTIASDGFQTFDFSFEHPGALRRSTDYKIRMTNVISGEVFEKAIHGRRIRLKLPVGSFRWSVVSIDSQSASRDRVVSVVDGSAGHSKPHDLLRTLLLSEQEGVIYGGFN